MSMNLPWKANTTKLGKQMKINVIYKHTDQKHSVTTNFAVKTASL